MFHGRTYKAGLSELQKVHNDDEIRERDESMEVETINGTAINNEEDREIPGSSTTVPTVLNQ